MDASLDKSPTLKHGLAFLAVGVVAAAITFAVIFTTISPWDRDIGDDAYGPPSPVFKIASFDALPGWREDQVSAALPAFVQSCERITKRPADAPANSQENLGDEFESWSLAGAVADWTPACEAAGALMPQDAGAATPVDDAARQFFERWFTPVEVFAKRTPLHGGPAQGLAPRIDNKGAFTGYFEPIYEARRAPEGRFNAPLYQRPDDLIDVDLGRFRADLAGERVAGRLDGTRLVPYPARQAINQGALDGRTQPLAWLDPDDLFFLQIQGSGRVTFDDGETMRIGYDGANGRPYTAIARILVQRGDMTVAEASMQSLRHWLASASTDDAQALRETNESYVFFRALPPPPEGFGPIGAHGAPLLPGRSLAVDRRFHAMGAPVFVDIEPVSANGADPIRKLMIAQDTGGAIRGPVRGDYFWGPGDEAAERAGPMNAQGRMFVLLPKARAEALAVREERL